MINQIAAAALTCMAQTAYMESRSESLQAQTSVMYVLYRRADFKAEKVCPEMQRPSQFSWVGKIKPPEPWSVELRPYYLLAKQVLNLKQPDYSEGATNFHDTSILKPRSWKTVVRVVQWNHLIFYKQEETRYVARN
jgi:hypothetical protein